MRPSIFRVVPAFVLCGAVAFTTPSFGQNSDFNLNVQANSNVTAKDIGLPAYPGATPFKDKDSDSSANLLLLLNSFHFSVKAASFVTADSPDRILEFYRKPMAKFGEVLECVHGKPVGSLTVTKSGLTCGNGKSGNVTVNGSDSQHELRAGKPDQFHIVGVESAKDGKTKFGLVALVLPNDESKK